MSKPARLAYVGKASRLISSVAAATSGSTARYADRKCGPGDLRPLAGISSPSLFGIEVLAMLVAE